MRHARVAAGEDIENAEDAIHHPHPARRPHEAQRKELRVNPATKATLIIGYVLAVPPLLGIVRALREPAGRLLWIPVPSRVALASELIGAGCVTAGFIALGRPSSWAFNGLWVIVCSTIWLRSENKLRVQRQRTTEHGEFTTETQRAQKNT